MVKVQGSQASQETEVKQVDTTGDTHKLQVTFGSSLHA